MIITSPPFNSQHAEEHKKEMEKKRTTVMEGKTDKPAPILEPLLPKWLIHLSSPQTRLPTSLDLQSSRTRLGITDPSSSTDLYGIFSSGENTRRERVGGTTTTKFRSLINSLADILPDPRGMIDGRPQSNIEVFLRRRMLDDSTEGPTPEVVSSSPSKTEGGHDKSNTEHSSSKPNHALNSANSPPIPKFEINPDKETIPASQRKDAPVKISPRLKHRLGGNQNT
ncbi:hypothetical protein BLNAU_15482 [Blattamonas nauphoetae]|uniref:Uncharacterized protein n=1 Tax=Blattamonas nauphoetae TaxID=2049346 RepID=A0ABQ9XE77_9EUKA|nr:hypothetical protein BLNAU_15482 [Blattamonas nauphoetae]